MGEELTGTMVERVAIERFVAARDDAGADVGEWRGAGAAWAAIVPDGAGAALGAARRTRRRWRVTMRAAAAVEITSRLVWRGMWLAVLAVESDPRRADRIVVRCEARV
ncbi:MAG: head-tail adaptor protein [Sandarakinorhabdus sp.]|nr:head-tail adaptor protein [Sandarakinorhabdus sp.]